MLLIYLACQLNGKGKFNVSVFTDKELEYMASQRLGRLATVNQHGHPQNAPVSFRYNPDEDSIDIGGRWMSQSKKYQLRTWYSSSDMSLRGMAVLAGGPPFQ